MLNILVLCPVLLAAAVQTLTIDSQLGTSIEDCFERISIGEQLPHDSIYRNVTELTTRECEQICKQDKQCQSYDYGVGAKGNATCDLSKSSEKEIKEKNLLNRHPDYDVYVRRFQCEQSPPSPIKPQFDDPEEPPSDKPSHRPVYRPVEEKVPNNGEYSGSSDLESYGVQKPVYKPQYDERPDDYTNPKPDYDSGPSYGAHKPQDTPYKPEKPVEKPSHTTRPDPYDVLQLQDPYRPNDRPSYPSNDFDKPNKRPYLPEKPEYQYVTRPKPKPQQDSVYVNKPDNLKPSYDESSYSGPNRPVTQNQYANGYGPNVPYDNNYIHVEIRDPPRPYDRPRPSDQGIYGYGTYSTNHFHDQSSHSQYYGGGTQNGYGLLPSKPSRPINVADMPYPNYLDGHYNSKPSYDSNKPYGGNYASYQNDYGSQANYGNSAQKPYGSRPYGDYNRPSNDPYNDYKRPSQDNYGEQGSYYSNQSTYGTSHDSSYGTSHDSSYGGSKPSYENDTPSYGSVPGSYDSGKPSNNNKPSYGQNDQNSYGNYKPSYSDVNPSYGNEKPSYGNDRPSYANDNPSYNNEKPEYGADKPSYSNDKPSYGSETPSYAGINPTANNDQPFYGNDKPLYGNGSNKPGYGNNRPSYNKPLHNNDSPSYEANKPTYGNDEPPYGGIKPSYGTNLAEYGSKPIYGSYGTQQDSYDGNQYYEGSQSYYGSSHQNYHSSSGYGGSYGGSQTLHGSQNDYIRPSYASNRPSSDQPTYGSSRPPSDQPSYGSSRPSLDQPSYDSNRPLSDQPTYGSSRPPSDQPSYGSNRPSSDQPSYGSNRPLSDQPTYGSNRPPSDQSSYGSNRPSSDQPSYGSNRPLSDHPTYGSNRPSSDPPSYGSNRPLSEEHSYGSSRPPSDQSSYGSNRPSSDQPSYGSNRPLSEEPSYGSNRPLSDPPKYGNNRPPPHRPSYGSNRPLSDQPSYGSNRPLSEEPSYGSKRPLSDQPTYGNNRPPLDRPSYGSNQPLSDQPSYGSNRPLSDPPSYGSNRPLSDQSSYVGNRPSSDEPSYGSNWPSSDQPSYDSNRPGYGEKPQKPNPIYGGNDDTSSSYGGSNNSPAYDENRPDHISPDNTGFGDTDSGYGGKSPNKTGVRPVYEYEFDKPINAPSYIARPGGQVVTSKPMAIGHFDDLGYFRNSDTPASYEACFRRVLAGKRALRSHVRRVVPCERLEDCRRECATERRFPCESFNYRLDRSFRGKGLCELMTKPIEAFDLLRDFVEDKEFDFFELDRNSLEPNCPETLRGPGILHSGFLSSKSNQVSGWTDKNDWFDGRHRDRNTVDRRGGYGNRNHDRIYIPYQINQGLGRSDEDEAWGQYGGGYGGTDRYYKDRNDYHKSVSHWRLASDIDIPYHGVKHYSNNHFDYNTLGKNGGEGSWKYGHGSWKRGRWNSSGNNNGLQYEESNFYKPKSHFHGVNEHGHDPIGRSDDGFTKDCSSRRRPGMSLGSGAIRRSLLSHNVVECEAACFGEREFKCVSYSFRYSSANGADNCFLSERPYRGLELAADSSSDVYAMPQDQGCVTINYKPWVESECFWHVRSGYAVSDTAIRAALTVGGLGACEAECIRAHSFFCRGFSFRYDSVTIGDDTENCILTSSPPTSLDNGHGLRPSTEHELYARGNYGRGCEPALYDDAQNRDEECYLQYEKAAKLTGSAIRGQARVKDEQSCGHACNDAPFTCLSFSFNNNAPPNTDNCLLSEIRLFDLQRGVDYVHSADDWLFAFDLFNGQCWRKIHSHHFDEPSPEIPRPLSLPPVKDPYSISVPPSGPPGITGPSGPSGPGYPPDHDPPFIPSGPPSGPGYKPSPPRYPPHPNLDYPEHSAPGKPHYPPGPSQKPGYSAPPGPVLKPGYPGPSFKPGYSGPSGDDFKPGYPELSFKPGYPAPPALDFRPQTNFRPGYDDLSGPEYPGPPRPDFKPTFIDPSGPGYKPGNNFKPGYPSDAASNLKPGYPPDSASNLKPGYPGIDNFKPAYPPPAQLDYPTGPPSPNYRPGYLPDPDIRPVLRPSGPQKPAFRPIDRDFIPGKPGYLPEKPGYLPDRRPEYVGPNRPLSDIPKPSRPVGRPGFPDRDIEEPMTASWRHYTVSGFPCRDGTTCAQNHIAGHWACEPEGGEIGSWDYCCAPTHRCGYSEGFHKPWCYVGPADDQWRPCSEKYYPYHQHKVPHPSQGHQNSPGQREPDRPPQRPWNNLPGPPAPPPVFNDRPQGPPRQPSFERPQGPYLSEADRRYWDELYSNGPQAYYDKFGNPLPGYSRVPTEERPHIKYSHNTPPPGTGQWLQVPQDRGDMPPPTLGVPRYWPVAYLHKGPPPNTTYFRYNETQPEPSSTTTERYKYTTTQREPQSTTTSQPNNVEKRRDEKQRNISVFENVTPEVTTVKVKPTTTELPNVKEEVKENKTEIEIVKPVNAKVKDVIKGIDDKLDDFTESIEVLDLDDVKGDKPSDLKTLEAEERQIEEIGRILASRRGGKLVLDNRSQKDLETKNIAIDKELTDYNFGNRFNIERRGIIQKVSKDEIERERNADKSLEVSETAYVRPPRILSTTDNIRKAIVNGKVFYDATIRQQREAFVTNSTRRAKNLRNADDSKISNLATASNFGKKIIKPRNVNPVRRVRRVYKKRYNPDEVRRRLLEREKSKESSADASRTV
ncbi:unnamed protein product [Arctia plantaginis]|uniref:Apple domain-containing protein n=1 Tax=Arctia plantaginis TaxID=874455 RepID=A0A8S1A1B0_ARCPL|nr:unnamed protein product [Arctia plantaginis]